MTNWLCRFRHKWHYIGWQETKMQGPLAAVAPLALIQWETCTRCDKERPVLFSQWRMLDGTVLRNGSVVGDKRGG